MYSIRLSSCSSPGGLLRTVLIMLKQNGSNFLVDCQNNLNCAGKTRLALYTTWYKVECTTHLFGGQLSRRYGLRQVVQDARKHFGIHDRTLRVSADELYPLTQTLVDGAYVALCRVLLNDQTGLRQKVSHPRHRFDLKSKSIVCTHVVYTPGLSYRSVDDNYYLLRVYLVGQQHPE